MDQGYSESSARTLRRLKITAIILGVLMAAGILALLVISRGEGEDITGIVAPALLFTLVTGGVAIVAAILQKRVEKATETSESKHHP